MDIRIYLSFLLLITGLWAGVLVNVAAAEENDDEKPHVVLVVGTLHYSPELTMPVFAKELERFGFRTTVVMGEGDPEKKTTDVLPGIKEALADADLMIFFSRFPQTAGRRVAADRGLHQIRKARDWTENRQSFVSLPQRSSSIRVERRLFGRRVLGTPYIVHQTSDTKIEVIEEQLDHPIMTNVTEKNWVSPGTLYLTRFEEGCVPLVNGSGDGRARTLKKAFGTIEVKPHESATVAWAWENEWGGKVFGTSFGHPGDFAEESFVRILLNAVHWSLDQPLPAADEKITTWQIERADKKPKKKAKPPAKKPASDTTPSK